MNTGTREAAIARAIGLGIERGELVARATAADDDDRIEVAPRRERGDGAADATRGGRALDADVAHAQVEPEAAADELVVEVVPGRGVDAAHDTDVERDRRRERALVGVEQAFGDQPANDVVALGGEIAEREARVEIAHLQPELAGRGIEVEVAEHAHLHPVGESEAMLLQHRTQLHPGVGEQLHVEHRLLAGGVVGEPEVGVLVRVRSNPGSRPAPTRRR